MNLIALYRGLFCGQKTRQQLRVMNSLEGPPELVQHLVYRGEFTSAQERCMSQIWYGLAISLAYPNGE